MPESGLTSEFTSLPTYTQFGDLRWTPHEQQRLMNSYPTITKEYLLALFPDRTWIAIRQKARRLELRQGPLRWSDDEDALLGLLTDRTRDFLLLSLFFPNRTPEAVRTRYYRFIRD